MICCKIVTNFSAQGTRFNDLVNYLVKIGDLYYYDGGLYFSDTVGKYSKKHIAKVMKKAGYQDFYINEYSADNVPQESDEANVWLQDKLIQMNYNKYEKESQQLFHDISKGLDILDREIDEIAKQNKHDDDVDSSKTRGEEEQNNEQ